jgi:hypothetical protein
MRRNAGAAVPDFAALHPGYSPHPGAPDFTSL